MCLPASLALLLKLGSEKVVLLSLKYKWKPLPHTILPPGHTPLVQRIYRKLWGKCLWESPAYTVGKTSLGLVWIFTHMAHMWRNYKIMLCIFVKDKFNLQRKTCSKYKYWCFMLICCISLPWFWRNISTYCIFFHGTFLLYKMAWSYWCICI